MTATRAGREAQSGRLLTEIYPPRWASPPPPSPARGRGRRAPAVAPEAPPLAAPPRAPRRAGAGSVAPELTESKRLELIDTFLALLEGLYAHLPLKRAMYALDPLQRLRLLGKGAADMEESAFNYELAGIITRLRDAHTRYVGPTRYAGSVATLPFLVESYGRLPTTRYIVSKVASDRSLIGDRSFVPGVELLWWNGVPIDRAVDVYADLETAGRPDSRRARALESLTLRSLQYGPPPDERWVVVGYRDLNRTEREVKIPWRVVRPGRASTAGRARIASARRYALDPARESARRAKKLLFAWTMWDAERRAVAPTPRRRARTGSSGKEWIDTRFQDAVAASPVTTSSGKFGYMRLWTFDVADDGPYLEEVIRLLGKLPHQGLIIDLRANPGGLIWAAERLLQLFGPQPISPTRFSLLATPLTRAMARAGQNEAELGPWRASLEEALATGEPYSLALPITPPELCNDIGQVYGGPVVAVVDANTYSAGDLFAAGFYDNGLGILVTVGEATGGGGANVWWPDQVQEALLGTGEFEQLPLPAGTGYSISVRRATRGAGEAVGAPIEDVGVRGHRLYAMTRTDLIEGNRDLLNFCGRLLASSPSTLLQIASVGKGAPTVRVTTRGLDRLDFYLDGRPAGWREVVDGPTTLDLPQGWHGLELQGYAADQLRQRRRL